MSPELIAATLASRQAGFVTHRQLLDAGLTRRMIEWRVESEILVSIGRGLYRLPTFGEDDRGLLRAAVAHLPDAVVSHESAAELHAVPYLRRGIRVVTVHAATTHSFPGVLVRRSRDLRTDHRTEIDGLPVTTLPRTVVDLAAILHPRHLAAVLDELLVSRRLPIDDVATTLKDVAVRGKPGVRALREILEERIGEVGRGRATALERLALAVFEEGGLPQPVWQMRAPWDPDVIIDHAWPDHRVGVEEDSRRWHTREADFERDRRKDRMWMVHGWRVLRVTWQDLTERPDEVVDHIRRAMDLQSAPRSVGS